MPSSLHNTSALILRNRAALTAPLCLLNPPDDALAIQLQQERHELLTAISPDFAVFQRLRPALGTAITYCAWPAITTPAALVVIFQPREKKLLEMWLAAIAATAGTGTEIWLVGENAAGIKSCEKRLRRIADAVSKKDSARHCSLFSGQVVPARAANTLADFAHWIDVGYRNRNYRLLSYPGVFAYRRLDPGSALLMESLATAPVAGDLLDFGCGTGVIGIAAADRDGVGRVNLIDSNALAVAAAEHNSAAHPRLTVFPSDGYSAVTGRYDHILSNPPFHQGVRQVLAVTERMIGQAPEHLRPGGELRFVANRHLPYVATAKRHFASVRILDRDNRFQVVSCRRPLRI